MPMIPDHNWPDGPEDQKIEKTVKWVMSVIVIVAAMLVLALAYQFGGYDAERRSLQQRTSHDPSGHYNEPIKVPKPILGIPDAPIYRT